MNLRIGQIVTTVFKMKFACFYKVLRGKRKGGWLVIYRLIFKSNAEFLSYLKLYLT